MIRLIIPLLVLSFLFSCEKEKTTSEKLRGMWEIQKTEINGDVNHSLDNLYFNFISDNTLKTNILGDSNPETDHYTLDGEKLTHTAATQDFNYVIDSISDNTLVLSAELRPKKNYRLLFSKAN